MVGEIRATMVDEFPETMEVRYGDRGYRVVPLSRVEMSGPATADLLRRWRDRPGGPAEVR